MPWDHCDVDFILDDEGCPRCGATKAQWSVQLDKTRHLVIGRRIRAEWERTRARVGDDVGLAVGPVKLADGERRSLRVFASPAGDGAPLAELQGTARGGRLLATWTAAPPGAAAGTPAATGLHFVADLGGETVSSGTTAEALLVLTDALEVQVVDADGRPRAGVRLEALLPGGARVTTTTDDQGCARWDDLPPGHGEVRVLAPGPRALVPAGGLGPTTGR